MERIRLQRGNITNQNGENDLWTVRGTRVLIKQRILIDVSENSFLIDFIRWTTHSFFLLLFYIDIYFYIDIQYVDISIYINTNIYEYIDISIY